MNNKTIYLLLICCIAPLQAMFENEYLDTDEENLFASEEYNPNSYDSIFDEPENAYKPLSYDSFDESYDDVEKKTTEDSKKSVEQKKEDPELAQNIENFFTHSKELEQEVNSTAENNLFFASEREELAPLFKKCDEVRTALGNFGKSRQHHGKGLYLDALLRPEFESVRATINKISPKIQELMNRIKKIQTVRQSATDESENEHESTPELTQANADRRKIIAELEDLGIDDQQESTLSVLAKKLTEVINSKPATEQKAKFLKDKKDAEKKVADAQKVRGRYANYEYSCPDYESKYSRGGNYAYNNRYSDSSDYESGYQGGYGSNYGSSGWVSDFSPSSSYNDFNSDDKSNDSKATADDKEKSDKRTFSATAPLEAANSLANKMLNHELMKKMLQLAQQNAINDNYVKQLTELYEHQNFKSFLEGCTKIIKKITELEDPTEKDTDADDEDDNDKKKSKEQKEKKKELSPGQKEFLKRLKIIIPVLIHLKMHPDQVIASSGVTEYKLPFASEELSPQDEESNTKALYSKVNELIEAINNHAEIKDTDKIKGQFKKSLPAKKIAQEPSTPTEVTDEAIKTIKNEESKPQKNEKPIKRVHFADRKLNKKETTKPIPQEKTNPKKKE